MKNRKWKLSDFMLNDNNIYMQPIDYKENYYFSDGEAIENYMLEILEKVYDRSSLSDELENYIKDWPTMYHFSKTRSNLLRFLENSKLSNKKVLEIGSGCGALTRYLGEKFHQVDSIEGIYKRALITRKRTSDLNNVRIFCTNVNDINFEPEYDIVTLIGVLEYSPIFIERRTEQIIEPAKILLENVSKSLKEDGILIISIENRIGLKYWLGFKDDHTGKLFDGLMNYPLALIRNCPITFSKKEIEKLLNDIGLKYIKFYYPFPDYKLPNIIISQQGCLLSNELNLYNLFDSFFYDYSNLRKYLIINDILVINSIIQENLLDTLSNSFLVLASKKDFEIENFIFKKYTSYRKRNFITETTLKHQDNNYYIFKKLIDGHNQNIYDKFKHNIIEKEPYYKGKLLIFDLIEYINSPYLISKLIEYSKILLDLSIKNFYINKIDNEGFALLDGKSVDFTFWNIIKDNDGNFIYIDKEWEFTQQISIDYLIFRNLLYFLLKYNINLNENLLDLIYYIMLKIFDSYNNNRLLMNIKIEEDFQSYIVNQKIDILKLLKETPSIKYIDDFYSYIETLENIKLYFEGIKKSRAWKLLQLYYRIKAKLIHKEKK